MMVLRTVSTSILHPRHRARCSSISRQSSARASSSTYSDSWFRTSSQSTSATPSRAWDPSCGPERTISAATEGAPRPLQPCRCRRAAIGCQKVDGDGKTLEAEGTGAARGAPYRRPLGVPRRRYGDPCWDRTNDSLLKRQELY